MHVWIITALDILTRLNEKQVLAEITYLRAVAPDIRQKRRVKMTDWLYKFEKFTLNDLENAIKCVIKPEGSVENNLDSLLKMLWAKVDFANCVSVKFRTCNACM